jgi:Domain of unknown function (DUF4304)
MKAAGVDPRFHDLRHSIRDVWRARLAVRHLGVLSGRRARLATVTRAREAMDAALKAMAKESLRARGFAGSLPHLHRRRDDRIELVSVQYHSAGGSFVVEIARCGAEGLTTGWGKVIAPSKVRAADIDPPNRPRLGSDTFPDGDHWFVFGPRSYEAGADDVRPESHYVGIAAEVARLIEAQAEPWWESDVARTW